MRAMRAVLWLCCFVLPTLFTAALDNGVALTPPRGFSTWNAFPTHSIDEKTARRYMQGLIKHGLNKLNYTYFVVDEPCFTGRDENGVLMENKTTWPSTCAIFFWGGGGMVRISRKACLEVGFGQDTGSYLPELLWYKNTQKTDRSPSITPYGRVNMFVCVRFLF